MIHIHCISIPARNPQHVASVLTELFEGMLTGFGSYRDSYIVSAGDEFGTAIVVFPTRTKLLPDSEADMADFLASSSPLSPITSHATVSVERSEEEIFALARREGWGAIKAPRGRNDVIEFWIENSVMLDLMTKEMARDYLKAATRRMRLRDTP